MCKYKQLEQMDMLLYLGSLVTEDGECTMEFRTRLKYVHGVANPWIEDS